MLSVLAMKSCEEELVYLYIVFKRNECRQITETFKRLGVIISSVKRRIITMYLKGFPYIMMPKHQTQLYHDKQAEEDLKVFENHREAKIRSGNSNMGCSCDIPYIGEKAGELIQV